ncbi:MAG TPA: right-handed parallel beta-helix repeat-containing protein [Rhizomicrobium sp.]|jgi:hypothetical protein
MAGFHRVLVLALVAGALAGCASNLPELPPAPMGSPAPPPDRTEAHEGLSISASSQPAPPQLASVEIPASAHPSSPNTLRVGPGEKYPRPSAAAVAASTGDTIIITAGHYTDCAVWKAGGITIAGEGEVVIGGTVCGGKGLFVVDGDNTSVRGITFSGAHSADGNGAGIRGEALNLTVENSVFLGNENGILATTAQSGTVIIRNSRFEGNGSCTQSCAHGIYIGHVALLRVENSVFRKQHSGHHIKSRALRTELVGNTLEDGPDGDASYLVDIPNGGALSMTRNTMQKGPRASNPDIAISIGEEGANNPTPEIVLEDNSFVNDLPHRVIFVRNLTGTTPKLTRNNFSGRVVPAGSPGA